MKAWNAIISSKCRTPNYDVMPKIRTPKILSIKFLKWHFCAQFLQEKKIIFKYFAIQPTDSLCQSHMFDCGFSIARCHRHIIIALHLFCAKNTRMQEIDRAHAKNKKNTKYRTFAIFKAYILSAHCIGMVQREWKKKRKKNGSGNWIAITAEVENNHLIYKHLPARLSMHAISQMYILTAPWKLPTP